MREGGREKFMLVIRKCKKCRSNYINRGWWRKKGNYYVRNKAKLYISLKLYYWVRWKGKYYVRDKETKNFSQFIIMGEDC